MRARQRKRRDQWAGEWKDAEVEREGGDIERAGEREREGERLFDSVSCIGKIQTGHSSPWIR